MAATLAPPAHSGFNPAIPQSFEDLGISQSLVLDLVLRRLMLEGFSNLQSLSNTLKLSVPVLNVVFNHMRQQQLVEVKGMLGNDYNFTLSQSGKMLAGERFQISQYAGAAPVSLKDYHAATKTQSAQVRIDRKILKSAFSDLVISDQLLDQLGPALISQNSIFVYGPTGNGKTSLAERMLRVYQDAVLMPYAVEVDNQVISLYDPVVHQRLGMDDPDVDPRWVLCRRPCIVVGGELIPSMLELRLDEASGIYAAPLQMKANNGIFIIDDFGRQLMSPRDLLNRWIVPLDRRVDYLMLRYGVKFQIPFELMVVFSTNLEPSDLADEAFLRRIHNKIFVDAVDEKSFDQIFHRVVTKFNIPCEPDSSEYLRKLCLREGRTELRACYPADICTILTSIGKYEGRPPFMSKSELERATALYFAKS
ncbi:MAG TPA: AAA family ATPase [Bryobacteraceae bacterium]|nr:AAA family ATPase [Bryobacteraceae bacterium]